MSKNVHVNPADADAHKALFLEKLAEGLPVTKAARAAGVAFTTVYQWRKEDETFRDLWEQAYAAGTDELADEARRRAVDGVTEPVFYKGNKCGAVQKYSDTLLIFMLKARDPQTYCDKLRAARILKAEADDAAKRARDLAETEHMLDAEVFERLEQIAAGKTSNTVN